MFHKILKTLSNYKSFLRNFFSFFVQLIPVIVGIIVILTFLQSKNINLISLLNSFIVSLTSLLQLQNIPIFIWVIIVILVFFLKNLSNKINIVAGEFVDNFDNGGLVNWEYGGEGWTVERGEGGYELSVTKSPDGGITNFGFWDSYEFNFECKIINKCIGWIVRATDREHYVMIQLSIAEKNPTINPHYRVPTGWFVLKSELKASKSLIDKIKSGGWIKIRIVVFGNTIDVFIDNERVLNHFIPDPVRLVTEKKYEWGSSNELGQKEIGLKQLESFSFPRGKVGFRCYGEEHAHIRKVIIKPLFWNNKDI